MSIVGSYQSLGKKRDRTFQDGGRTKVRFRAVSVTQNRLAFRLHDESSTVQENFGSSSQKWWLGQAYSTRIQRGLSFRAGITQYVVIREIGALANERRILTDYY